MSKYIIDIPNGIEWGVVTCRTEDGFYTRDFDSLEELNFDYINEHFGSLQDEAYQKGINDGSLDVKQRVEGAYQKGFEDGKKSVSDPDRIEVGDEVISDAGTKYTVTSITDKDSAVGFSGRGLWCFNAIDKLTKTGKHYDIASILEAMRE